MKWSKRSNALFLALSLLAGGSWAADETRSFQVKNRLRFEYDDNVYERANDTQDSFKIVEEVEFLVNLNLPQSFVGLRYRPTFVWWSDRESDDTDFHHDLDVTLSHTFTERLSISLKDTLRLAEQSEAIDRGTVVRENNDFIYNTADGKLAYKLGRGTRAEAGYRNTILRYDENDVADTEDYDINAGGLTLRQQILKKTVIAGEYRYEAIDYNGPDRGAESHYAGAGFEQIFSPNLVGNLRAGYQMKQFNDNSIDDANQPYADAAMTYLPSPRTRLTAGAGYSLFEADVYPYASQDRTMLFLSVAHDLTAKISIYASGSYQLSQYNADQSIEDGVADGDENVYQFSARTSCKINRSNWVEVGWQYLELQSDIREDFDRNRIELGWRTQI
ncbi:MAG: outer membrane beta-barrel protein [bacterium]